MRQGRPLRPREVARILREVSWALAYAHARGVIHRDVKPDNILLEEDTGRALATDFGIAQVTEGQGLTGLGLLGVAVLWFAVAAVVTMVAGIEMAALFYAGLAVVMGAVPAGLLWKGARHLLRSGFTREHVVLALRSEIEEQEEELAFAFGGKATWLDRLALSLAYGGLAVATVGTGAMMFLELSFDAMVIAGLAIGVGGLTSLAASPWAALGPRHWRKKVWGEGLVALLGRQGR